MERGHVLPNTGTFSSSSWKTIFKYYGTMFLSLVPPPHRFPEICDYGGLDVSICVYPWEQEAGHIVVADILSEVWLMNS